MSKKKKYLNKKICCSDIFIIFWTILRMGAVTLLWWNITVGYFINIFLDAVDGDILERISLKRDWYENWDKWLDLWFYIALAVFIYLNMEKDMVWILLLGLFLYRLIGSILFSITKKEWILLVFPNIFTELFLVNLFFHNFIRSNFIFTITLLVIFSLIKEWWIHIAKIDITDLITGKKKKWK